MACRYAILGGLFLAVRLVSSANATPIHDAITSSDLARVEEILRTNPSAVNDDSYAGSPLRLAALLGQLDILKALLASGGDINRTDSTGEAPLHAASGFEGNQETVLFLLDHGARIDVRNTKNGRTPLHIAVSRGKPAVVSIFLSHGAPVDAKDGLEETPLHGIIDRFDKGMKTMAEVLVAKGADVNAANTNGYTVLHKLALRRHAGLSWPQIREGVGLPLIDAGYIKDELETADFLISHGAKVDADADGFTPLHYAVSTEKPELVELLIKRGADVNARNKYGDTPLQFARFAKSPESVAVLRRHGAQ